MRRTAANVKLTTAHHLSYSGQSRNTQPQNGPRADHFDHLPSKQGTTVGGYEGETPIHRCPQIPRVPQSSQFRGLQHNSHTKHAGNDSARALWPGLSTLKRGRHGLACAKGKLPRSGASNRRRGAKRRSGRVQPLSCEFPILLSAWVSSRRPGNDAKGTRRGHFAGEPEARVRGEPADQVVATQRWGEVVTLDGVAAGVGQDRGGHLVLGTLRDHREPEGMSHRDRGADDDRIARSAATFATKDLSSFSSLAGRRCR